MTQTGVSLPDAPDGKHPTMLKPDVIHRIRIIILQQRPHISIAEATVLLREAWWGQEAWWGHTFVLRPKSEGVTLGCPE